MTDIQQIELSTFFTLFAPTHILGTTYTISLAFFEMLVWPYIDRSKLQKCVILCDQLGFQRVIDESIALHEVGHSYMIVTVPAACRFHPKVWFMLNETEVALLVGSGNLTQSGFIDNLELFDVIRFSRDHGHTTIAEDILTFLRGLKTLWDGVPHDSLLVVDTLSEMQDRLESLSQGMAPESTVRFLTSFSGPFPDQLKRVVEPGCTMYIAAPYFGGSAAALAALQHSLSPKETYVFPAIHPDASIDLPRAEVQSLPNTQSHATALAQQDDHKKFAHFKLYGFINRDRSGWLFSGSVNCTQAALQGRNIEAGILRQVSPATVQAYFRASTLPPAALRQPQAYEIARSDWLILWATDLGSRIEVVTAPADPGSLPLRDVTWQLRVGSQSLQAEQSHAFDSSNRVELPWTLFGQFRPSRQVYVLELYAHRRDGDVVHGACFVDNRMALTADPTHRGAWRAALALLDEARVPAPADLAALFAMLKHIESFQSVDTRLTSGPSEATTGRTNAQEEHELIPLWPPVMSEGSVLGVAMGRGGSDVYWFQRILWHCIIAAREGRVSDTRYIDDETDRSFLSASVRDPLTKHNTSGYEQVWNLAHRGFETIENTLACQRMTEQFSGLLWPITVATLLMCLAVRKTLLHTTYGTLSVPSTSELLRRFVVLLFRYREQQDASPPVILPPIATELASLRARPHDDLAAIVFAIFCYLKAHNPHSYVSFWLCYRSLIEDDLTRIAADTGFLQGICEQYLLDGQEGLLWKDISPCIGRLLHTDWTSHTGYQDVVRLRDIALHPTSAHGPQDISSHVQSRLQHLRKRIHKQGKIFFVSAKADGYCVAPDCSKPGMYDPMKRRIRDLFPVICDPCGAVMLPPQLLTAYESLHDDKLP